MLSPDLCRTLETAFQNKMLVRIEIDQQEYLCGLYLGDRLTEATTTCFAIAYTCRMEGGRTVPVRSMLIDVAKINAATLLGPLPESVLNAMQTEEGEISPVDRELKP